MKDCEKILQLLLDVIESNKSEAKSINEIPIGISNRHIHLSKEDLEALFGENYELSKLKDLSQPGQYACKEILTVCGPKGAIEKVRILGPTRKETQVEILSGDCFKLGVESRVRLSGNLDGTPGLTLIGPKGSVQIKKGVIVAQRHIHMHTEDAKKMNLHDGQVVSVKVKGPRGGIFDNVVIRANDSSALECHLDFEESNSMSINAKTIIEIVN